MSPTTEKKFEENLPIGIFGGTFDPIHLGHLHLAKKVLTQIPLEKIFFVPCRQSPLRAPPEGNVYDRLQMIKLALQEENNPAFIADERELNRRPPSFSIETVRSFRQQFGGEKSLCLIIAMDAFLHFTHWHKWQQILDNVHLLVASRGQYEPPKESLLLQLCNERLAKNEASLINRASGYIFFIDIAPLPISATQIRAAIQKGENVAELLPNAVLQYIIKNKLYQTL